MTPNYLSNQKSNLHNTCCITPQCVMIIGALLCVIASAGNAAPFEKWHSSNEPLATLSLFACPLFKTGSWFRKVVFLFALFRSSSAMAEPF